MATEMTATVQRFWERDTCGTAWAEHTKFTRAYYDDIEVHRYRLEPFIHAFAQFTRYYRKRVLAGC